MAGPVVKVELDSKDVDHALAQLTSMLKVINEIEEAISRSWLLRLIFFGTIKSNKHKEA